MLVEPERTAYDLRFRLLGFPVRVHPLFWLVAILMGLNISREGMEFLLIWVLIVFVSILVHELGHAIAFRWFGSPSNIVLYSFGGLAIPYHNVSGRWRRIVISLAGPFAGFLLSGFFFGLTLAFPKELLLGSSQLRFFVLMMVYVNLFWGILNLLPVFPLDGGQVSRELCGMRWGAYRGVRISLQISFVSALIVVGYTILCILDREGMGAGLTNQLPWWVPRGSIFTALLFGVLAHQSYELLQRGHWGGSNWEDDTPPWAR